jgi:hypothetical protein
MKKTRDVDARKILALRLGIPLSKLTKQIFDDYIAEVRKILHTPVPVSLPRNPPQCTRGSRVGQTLQTKPRMSEPFVG